MLYIWIKYDGVKNYEPHISFEDEDKEDALFEIQTLREGDVEGIEIENVYLKKYKGFNPENETKIEFNIDGLGSWNIDLDEGIGKYKDVTEQLEEEVYDKFMSTR